MSEININLKSAREKKKMSYSELAKQTGIPKSTLQRYETGTTMKIPMEAIKKIAKSLSVSENMLMGLPQNMMPIKEMIQLPIYGKVSAGSGALLEEDIIGYEYAESKYSNNEYFYLMVTGDSMSPKLEDGDKVLVKKQPSIDSGTIGVFAIDEEDAVVKKVIYGNKFIELHSINPYYPVRAFKDIDVTRIRVIGQVIKSVRDF